MGKKLYSDGEMLSPITDYESVKNADGKTLKQDIDGIGQILHGVTEEEFEVDVQYESPIKDSQLTDELGTFAPKTKYKHKCYFKAFASDKKAKLIISMPGGGMKARAWYDYMNTGEIFNSLGYAVLCITGYSADYMALKGVTSGAAPVGSWYATEEVIKAYKYLTEKYKWIDTEGVYIYAESQGGNIAENVVDAGGMPIKAVALDAPALSIQLVQMSLRISSVTAIYGITSGNFDKNKCIGCDPWTRNVSEPLTTDYNTLTAKKYRNTNSPLLIIGGLSDALVSPSTLKSYSKALMNAGQWVEYHAYPNVAHGVVELTPVYGRVGTKNCTHGLADVLSFFERSGGYDFNAT